MKRRTLLSLAAASMVPAISTSAQVSPNQPTAEPSPSPEPTPVTIQGDGWKSTLDAERVEKVQPVDGGRFLVSFSEPENGQILELAQHTRKNDVFITGPSGIQTGEDYQDTLTCPPFWSKS